MKLGACPIEKPNKDGQLTTKLTASQSQKVFTSAKSRPAQIFKIASNRAKEKKKRLREINEIKPNTDLNRRNSSFIKPSEPFTALLSATSSRRDSSMNPKWDKRRRDSLQYMITNSGKKKREELVFEIDRYGRPVIKRKRFFKLDEDFDHERNTIKASSQLFTRKIENLPKDEELARVIRQLDQKKGQRL